MAVVINAIGISGPCSSDTLVRRPLMANKNWHQQGEHQLLALQLQAALQWAVAGHGQAKKKGAK
jgi:hypothetical protein